MKRYNITNDQKGGIKAVESNTGHWMLAAEVERMLQDLKPSKRGNAFDDADWEEYFFKHCEELKQKGNDNGN